MIHYPLMVLGIGKRVGVWTQGCSLGCQGCMSKHSWNFNGGERIDLDELLERLESFGSSKITISGGEPFEQKYFLEFLQGLKSIRFDDILVYSGYEWRYIKRNFSNHLEYIDALVYGRFEQGKESESLYKGSENQELVILNKVLYTEYTHYKTLKKDKRLQKVRNYIIGIPYQKDLERLKDLHVI